MKTTKMIIDEFKTMLETYIKQYAEYMYYVAQINSYTADRKISELVKAQPDSDIHRTTLKNVLDDLYWKYAENVDTEDAYDDAEEQFEDIIKDAKHEACKRAEMMRRANGIYLND